MGENDFIKKHFFSKAKIGKDEKSERIIKENPKTLNMYLMIAEMFVYIQKKRHFK